MQLKSQQIGRRDVGLSLILIALLGIACCAPLLSIRMSAAAAYGIVLIVLLYRYWSSRTTAPVALAAAITSMCAFFSIGGSVLFYSYNLSAPAIWSLGVAAALLPLALRPTRAANSSFNEAYTAPLRSWALLAISAVNALAALCLVSARATTASSQSPWPHLPSAIFILFFLAVVSAMFFTLQNRTSLPLITTGLLLLLTLGVVTIIYPLGYGFDPSIHQATEQLLLETGTIHPQPFFYMGHYALITAASTYTGIPITLVDSYLTLLLAVVLIPLVLRSFVNSFSDSSARGGLSIFFLLIPYAYLIQSTPQSVSFLFSLFSVFLIAARLKGTPIPFSLLFMFSLTALAFHPLTGLPLLCAVCLLYVRSEKRLSPRVRASLATAIAVALIAAVPAALCLAGYLSPEFSLTFRFALPHVSMTAFSALLRRAVRFDDSVYALYSLLWLLLTVSALIAVDHSARAMRERSQLFLPLCGVLIAVSALVLSSLVSFNFMPGEQTTFAIRLMVLAGIFFYPVILEGLLWMTQRIQGINQSVFFMWLALLACGALTAWYMSYPRFDALVQNKGYTTSADDYAAVHWIDANAAGTPYVVLANQSVSAGAVKEFGFAHYYGGMFYYPLPTNGPLHQLFLKAMDPSISIQDTIAETQRATGVQRIYIILNDYWTQAETLKAKLTEHATLKQSLGRDTLFIFE